MANLAPNPVLVVPGSGAGYVEGRNIAGAALVGGDVVYLKTSDQKWYLADCNTATAPVDGAVFPPEAMVGGICVTQVAAVGQPIQIQNSGPLTIGDAVVKAGVYVLSATPGKICPIADLVAAQTPPQNLVIIALASSVTVLEVDIQITNIAK